MRLLGSALSLSATDLSGFLSCGYLTALDMGVAFGTRTRPFFDDPLLKILFERGLAHERAYVQELSNDGRKIVDLSEIKERELAIAKTLDAMKAGADVIVQGALSDRSWYGRPDIMQRLEKPSAFGGWSYEISDTKLAQETRAGTILQLSLYSEMLRLAQNAKPEFFHVVTPSADSPLKTFRVDDYAAYFRLVRRQMEEAVARGDAHILATTYPEPVDHCEICGWSSVCRHKRREDDHLSLVAGISRLQRRELEGRSVSTLTALAQLPIPLQFKPSRGSPDTYTRVREQARLQFDSRGKVPPLHELRDVEPGLGLCRLPEPCPGDVFLDLEGDLFAVEGGREYLFGVVTIGEDGKPHYQSYWAFTDHEERIAFEQVMDLIMDSWKKHEGMHVYHYAPYEPSAFKRLMGRYASREDALDRMLRASRFVDLYAVVRQGVMAGIERYSIKNLEPLYDFQREVDLSDANRSLRLMEQGLELDCPDAVPKEVRNLVEGYNKDDCVSTLHLRTWLEALRAQVEATGVTVPRPVLEAGDPSENVDEKAQRVCDLRARLLDGVPENRAERNAEQHANWLLAYMLDWHRREDKAGWWEYYRLREMPEEDLLLEPQALAGMEFVERVEIIRRKKGGRPTGSVIDRYRYPEQEMEIDPGAELKLQDESTYGTLVATGRIERTVDIRKGPKQADNHAAAAFAHKHIRKDAQEAALFALGEAIAANGFGRCEDGNTVARELLLANAPRLKSGPFVQLPAESASDFAVAIGTDLDHSVLAIQGPPGAGKTYTGARMICALIKAGKKVGITANSHSVIRNLLDEVNDRAKKDGASVKLAHKCDEDDEKVEGSPVREIEENAEALEALKSGAANVLGGTAWLWARPEFKNSVDTLFVDEAGQMSLANALAVSHCAESIVLLGDPQQLDQPKKGSHPEGVGASALQHILGEQQTISPDRGIFLPVTWRLAPSICAFTSELFYEGRLTSKPGLEEQRLIGLPNYDGSGLWVVNVDHVGNTNASPEEVDVVAELVDSLTRSSATWVEENGPPKPLRAEDVLIVSPYNAQVTRLSERLRHTKVRIGTVDKIQGQQAAVVIYSTATSSPEDAPRGMGFLYSPNRLNVATSRARCASILVTSTRLFEPECRSPKQMKLANALCRYREMANSGTSPTAPDEARC